MTDILKTVRDKFRSYLLWGLLFSLLIVPLGAAMTVMVLHEGNGSKPYVPKLQKIADETPVFPDFQRVGDDFIVLKNGRASLQRSFRTNAQFADIRKFYDATLAKAGWGPPHVLDPSIIVGEQHYVSYHRDSYEFDVYQNNGNANVYSIAVIWSE